MAHLTNLTSKDVIGLSRTAVINEVLDRVNDAAAKAVADETERLTGLETSAGLVYNTRAVRAKKKATSKKTAATTPANGAASNGKHMPAAIQADPAPQDKKIAPLRLHEVVTFFEVRDMVTRVGGLENMKQYLDLVEMEIEATAATTKAA
jgi:hypothetical protein